MASFKLTRFIGSVIYCNQKQTTFWYCTFPSLLHFEHGCICIYICNALLFHSLEMIRTKLNSHFFFVKREILAKMFTGEKLFVEKKSVFFFSIVGWSHNRIQIFPYLIWQLKRKTQGRKPERHGFRFSVSSRSFGPFLHFRLALFRHNFFRKKKLLNSFWKISISLSAFFKHFCKGFLLREFSSHDEWPCSTYFFVRTH